MQPRAKTSGGSAGDARPEAIAVCALASVPGVGPVALDAIANRFGSFASALEAGPRKIAAAPTGLRPASAAYLARGPDLAAMGRWVLETVAKAGAQVLLRGDETYPVQLARIPNPPAVLYVRGEILPQARRIAVVGSRDSDVRGLELAEMYGELLARAGVEVVSGGARGVDAAAHEGALAGGKTVAVLGTGIDLPYPRRNAPLFDRIASGGGAVVTEFPPGMGAFPSNFPQRNRTLSGLSDAVVVVRAARTSGALLTADHAKDQGRRVFAVVGPGFPAGDPLSAGPRKLVADGALPVAAPDDVLRELKIVVPILEQAGARPGDEPVDLEEMTLRVWRGLDAGTPAHVDDLALRAQIPAHRALRALAELELKGMCLQRPGKLFLRR